MTRTTARLTGPVGALLAGALAGCSGDSTHDGMSGMSGASSASSSAEASSADGTFNDADVTFAQGMLPHHQQAIEMAQLAESRAADPRVMDLAARIEAAQGPEIDTLSGWLAEWAADTPTEGGMAHGGNDMGGMMSEEDMAALMAASGPEFDRLFLEQMIAHHTGAVKMAQTEAAQGKNPDAIAMAETIRDTQNAEISEMRQLLTELGG